MLASRSVWGTIESQVQMRHLTVVGANLLLLWSLSPLGGQASFRALDKQTRMTTSTQQLRYLDTGVASAHLLAARSIQAHTDNLYISALTASTEMKMAPQDNWGNVKVPQLEALSSSSPCDG